MQWQCDGTLPPHACGAHIDGSPQPDVSGTTIPASSGARHAPRSTAALVLGPPAPGPPRRPAVDISIAVATDTGLITPIIRGADQKPLQQIAAEVRLPRACPPAARGVVPGLSATAALEGRRCSAPRGSAKSCLCRCCPLPAFAAEQGLVDGGHADLPQGVPHLLLLLPLRHTSPPPPCNSPPGARAGRAGARQPAEARGVPGRLLLHLQPGHVRRGQVLRHHQPAAGAGGAAPRSASVLPRLVCAPCALRELPCSARGLAQPGRSTGPDHAACLRLH